MRRLALICTVALFVVALMSSCKSADCPAYSQVDDDKVEQTA